MSNQVTVLWKASKDLQKRDVVVSGKFGASDRRTTFDLGEMSQEERALLVPYLDLWNDGNGAHQVDVSYKYAPCKEGATARNFSLSPNYVPWDRVAVELDAPPTVVDVVNLLRVQASCFATAKASCEMIDKEKEAEAATREAERAKTIALYERERETLEAYIKTEDWALVKAYVPPNGLRDFSHRTSGGSSWSPTLEQLQKTALLKYENTMRDVEREEWIERYGSSHLKMAVAEGYDCTRLYIKERSNKDLQGTGYEIDYTDSACWQERVSPSLRALEAAKNDRELANTLGCTRPEVVWLTAEPIGVGSFDEQDDDGHVDSRGEVVPHEAVVMRHYLGSYDLVKCI